MATGSRMRKCCSCFLKIHRNNLSSYALNEHYGSADDLKALADALHKRGMYLMVDVVANHMVR